MAKQIIEEHGTDIKQLIRNITGIEVRHHLLTLLKTKYVLYDLLGRNGEI